MLLSTWGCWRWRKYSVPVEFSATKDYAKFMLCGGLVGVVALWLFPLKSSWPLQSGWVRLAFSFCWQAIAGQNAKRCLCCVVPGGWIQLHAGQEHRGGDQRRETACRYGGRNTSVCRLSYFQVATFNTASAVLPTSVRSVDAPKFDAGPTVGAYGPCVEHIPALFEM